MRSFWQKRVQEIRVDERDPTIVNLKKLIRAAAKEKNDPVFGSILDPVAREDRNNAKPRSGPSSSLTMHTFAGSTD